MTTPINNDAHVQALDNKIESELTQAFQQHTLPERAFDLTSAPSKHTPEHAPEHAANHHHFQGWLKAVGLFACGVITGSLLHGLYPASEHQPAPMQDALNIHRQLTLHPVALHTQTATAQAPLLQQSQRLFGVDIESILPALHQQGFHLTQLQQVASPMGAGLILLYQHPEKPTLTLFIRQDHSQTARQSGVHWRQDNSTNLPLNVGFFYLPGLAIAVTHPEKHVIESVIPNMYQQLGM